MKYLFVSLLAAAVVCTGCGPFIYTSANFEEVAKTHRTVAILPAQVLIELRPNEMRRTTPEQLEKNEAATGYVIQEVLYGWFLRRSNRLGYTVTFQDVSETNALLEKAGYEYDGLFTKPKSDLARLLGVDAVITTSLRTDKPVNQGVALAVGVMFGAWGPTNRVFTTINIHEGKASDLIWKYDFEAAGSVGSSPENLVNALMRNASRRFPYNSR